MTINDAMTALADDLAAGGVPDPLAQPFTLANIWHDLATLAGEPVPALVRALTEDDTAELAPAFVARLLAATPEAFAGILAAEADRAYRRG